MDKLYGVVIGQCLDAVLSVLGNDIEYISKDEECDVIWLLRKLKTITSGLDSKSNKRSCIANSGEDATGTEQIG